MDKKKKIENLILKGESFFGKNFSKDNGEFQSWNTELISFAEKVYGENANITKTFKSRSYTGKIPIINETSTSYVRYFEQDLKASIGDLKNILEDDDFYYAPEKHNDKNQSKTNLTLNQNFINSNTNVNAINVKNITEIKNEIEDNTYLSDSDKTELLKILEEIEKIKNSDESKTKKWDKLKKSVAFIIDKGADIAIAYLPQIIMAISK